MQITNDNIVYPKGSGNFGGEIMLAVMKSTSMALSTLI